jgi:prenyl protein peptidase
MLRSAPISIASAAYEELVLGNNLIVHKVAKMRDLIIGPATEEFCFRAAIIPILRAAGVQPARVIVLAPVFFGIAHLHHAANLLALGHSVNIVLQRTVFQFLYTTVFGIYVSYAFLHTNSLVAVCLCHSFCNFMGLPDVSFLSREGDSSLRFLYPHRHAMLATYAIGIASFGMTMSYY